MSNFIIKARLKTSFTPVKAIILLHFIFINYKCLLVYKVTTGQNDVYKSFILSVSQENTVTTLLKKKRKEKKRIKKKEFSDNVFRDNVYTCNNTYKNYLLYNKQSS